MFLFSSYPFNNSLTLILGALLIPKQLKYESIEFETFKYPLMNIVWLCIFFTILMVVITKLLVTRGLGNMFEIIWSTFAVFFGGSFYSNQSSKLTYRIVTFLTLFFGNIVWMGYQASLTVDLSVPSHKLPFNSLETFLNTNWKLYTFDKSTAQAHTFTHATQGSLYHKVYMNRMSQESFSTKTSYEAMEDFMYRDKSAFYAFTDGIPKELVCNVSSM